MKKDIIFPEVKDVYIAIVKEFNVEYQSEDWNAYIINDKEVDLELVLIVSHGYNSTKTTVTFRKKLDKLAKKSYAKIELLQEAVFALNNQFKVTFFEGNQLFDKTFLFRENTINEKAFQPIPLMEMKGVYLK